MSRTQLVAYAAAKCPGLTLRKSWKKEALVAAIAAKLGYAFVAMA